MEGGFLTQDSDYSVTVAAHKAGLFSFAANLVNESGMIDGTIEFKNVPASEKTQGTFNLSASDLSPNLSLDLDGDDVVDFVVPANRPTRPEIYTSMVVKIIETLNLQEGLTRSLKSKLEAVLAALQRDNQKAALGTIRAFISEVEAQQDKNLTRTQARVLIEFANNLMALIGT